MSDPNRRWSPGRAIRELARRLSNGHHPVIALLVVCLFSAVALPAAGATLSDGVAAYERHDYMKAWELLIRFANDGDAQAQYLIGVIYDEA